MATGDITSCTVRADGWSADVVIEGFTTGATYDFGSFDDTPPTTSDPKFTMTVVSEGYNSSGVLGTISRTVYGKNVVRVPTGTATIAGSFTSGTFVDDETVTQAVSGATAKIVGGQSAGATLRVKVVAGTPNTTNIWTGGTSAATFTPTATPSTLAANTKDELYDGSNLKVRIAFTESIYNDDKNGGAGTSGTNPTVTISAGWCTNTGGAAQTSAVATNLSCTNNSTLDYPKVVAQWAWGHTPGWRMVTAAFDIGCIAYAGHGIACVALSATEGVNVVSGTSTTKSSHLMSASGLYYESYDLSVPVTSFTSGNDVTLRFIAYPNVGDADSLIDTDANTTAADDIRGLTKITCTYNPTVTTMYVAQNGDDTTGNGTTGTPYATIGKALAQNPGIVYVQAGGTNVVDILGTAPASVTAKNYFIDVMPKPGDEATVSLTRTSAGLQWKAKLLRYSGFTFSGGNAYIDGNNVASAKLWFDNCTMSVASTPTVSLAYRAVGAFYVNCTETSGLDYFHAFGTDVKGHSFTGCSFTSGAKIQKCSGFIACKMAGSAADKNILEGNNAGTSTQIESNLIFANNKIINSTVNANQVVTLARAEATIAGMAVVGNVIEVKTITSSQPALWIAADSSSNSLSSVIIAHNTVVGERCNLFYNDTGSTARNRNNIFIRNNAFRSYNIKTDTFGTANGSRIGNWETVNGVNVSDNRYDGTGDTAFTNDHEGINCSYVTAKNQTYGQLGYTDDNSSDGDGTGNGDYIPTTSSVLYNHTLRVKYLSYDMNGVSL